MSESVQRLLSRSPTGGSRSASMPSLRRMESMPLAQSVMTTKPAPVGERLRIRGELARKNAFSAAIVPEVVLPSRGNLDLFTETGRVIGYLERDRPEAPPAPASKLGRVLAKIIPAPGAVKRSDKAIRALKELRATQIGTGLDSGRIHKLDGSVESLRPPPSFKSVDSAITQNPALAPTHQELDAEPLTRSEFNQLRQQLAPMKNGAAQRALPKQMRQTVKKLDRSLADLGATHATGFWARAGKLDVDEQGHLLIQATPGAATGQYSIGAASAMFPIGMVTGFAGYKGAEDCGGRLLAYRSKRAEKDAQIVACDATLHDIRQILPIAGAGHDPAHKTAFHALYVSELVRRERLLMSRRQLRRSLITDIGGAAAGGLMTLYSAWLVGGGAVPSFVNTATSHASQGAVTTAAHGLSPLTGAASTMFSAGMWLSNRAEKADLMKDDRLIKQFLQTDGGKDFQRKLALDLAPLTKSVAAIIQAGGSRANAENHVAKIMRLMKQREGFHWFVGKACGSMTGLMTAFVMESVIKSGCVLGAHVASHGATLGFDIAAYSLAGLLAAPVIQCMFTHHKSEELQEFREDDHADLNRPELLLRETLSAVTADAPHDDGYVQRWKVSDGVARERAAFKRFEDDTAKLELPVKKVKPNIIGRMGRAIFTVAHQSWLDGSMAAGKRAARDAWNAPARAKTKHLVADAAGSAHGLQLLRDVAAIRLETLIERARSSPFHHEGFQLDASLMNDAQLGAYDRLIGTMEANILQENHRIGQLQAYIRRVPADLGKTGLTNVQRDTLFDQGMTLMAGRQYKHETPASSRQDILRRLVKSIENAKHRLDDFDDLWYETERDAAKTRAQLAKPDILPAHPAPVLDVKIERGFDIVDIDFLKKEPKDDYEMIGIAL